LLEITGLTGILQIRPDEQDGTLGDPVGEVGVD